MNKEIHIAFFHCELVTQMSKKNYVLRQQTLQFCSEGKDVKHTFFLVSYLIFHYYWLLAI